MTTTISTIRQPILLDLFPSQIPECSDKASNCHWKSWDKCSYIIVLKIAHVPKNSTVKQQHRKCFMIS